MPTDAHSHTAANLVESAGDAHKIGPTRQHFTELRASLSNARDVAGDLDRQMRRYEDALREIGLPASPPAGFDPLEWWRHTACKRGEIARDALGVTAEELILHAQD